MTIGLGAAAVAGFYAVSIYKPRPESRVVEAPRPPAPIGTRYGADDRDKLNRQIASAGDPSRKVAALSPPGLIPPADVAPRRMTPADWRVIDTNFAEQLRRCWPSVDAPGQGYMPVVKVEFDAQGALAGRPMVIGAHNARETAAGQALVDALMRCGPMKVPAELRGLHAQWKTRTIRLDPPQMSGL
ncbi:MAG: TolA protein [Hyphomicrobiales bacterium]|nr:TolA protein [Hyphomicrobiales bacterium]